ncbi:MAG: hypothetical protein HY319_31795 [Armatimonadetes bacterium]|nr:hypothetical protein [Armatimonadota bacterium]
MLAVYVLFGILLWLVGLAMLRDRSVLGEASKSGRGMAVVPEVGERGEPRASEAERRPRVAVPGAQADRSYLFKTPSGDRVYLN